MKTRRDFRACPGGFIVGSAKRTRRGGFKVDSGEIELNSQTTRSTSGAAEHRSRSASDHRSPSAQRGRADTGLKLRSILDRVESRIGADQFERYFDGQTRVRLEGDVLEVVLPTPYLAQMIDRRFGQTLRDACAEVAPTVSVTMSVDRDAFPADQAPVKEPSVRPATKSGAAPSAGSANGAGGKFSFANFIVGQSNRLAHAAAVRLAEEEGAGSIFVHGICGVGKTHLLQALLHHYQLRHPKALVRYTTAEAFTNEFIAAVRSNKVENFRKSYRRVSLLCIDDVHFIAGKDATQTELLHTLDSVGLDGAKIALASDEPPREIRKLNEKLVSRFMSGIVARVDTPDPELREKLVRQLAHRRSMKIEDAAIKIIADRSARSVGSLGGYGGSVRELEGLMMQVEAVHRLLPEFSNNGSVGAILVRKAFGMQESDLGAGAGRGVRRPIAIESVIDEVCRALTVDLDRLMGKGRHKRVVLARSMIAFLARKLTTMSFPEIARAMGRPNHSTVITAQRRLEKELTGNPEAALGIELCPANPSCGLRELTEHLTSLIHKGNQPS